MILETMLYIIAFVFGLLLGNYSTTLLYRIPRAITICGFQQKFTNPPFCSYCSHLLKPWEYLPFISWFSTLGKCNYCGHKINKLYTFLEILNAITGVLLYALIGFSDQYILLMLFFSICCVAGAIYLTNQNTYMYLIIAIVFLGSIYFTLQDHTINDWLFRTSLAAILVMFIRKKDSNFLSKKTISHIIIISATWISDIGFLFLYIILGLGLQLIVIAILNKFEYKNFFHGKDLNTLANSSTSMINSSIKTKYLTYYDQSLAFWFFWLAINVLYLQIN